MASSTSRIIKLAVPSIFGLLSLILLRKVITFKRQKNKVIALSTSTQSQLLQEKNSSLEGFTLLEDMRLKENDSDLCSDSCGISCSHIEKSHQEGEITMANGVTNRNQNNDERKDMVTNGIDTDGIDTNGIETNGIDISNKINHNLKLKLRNAEEKQNPKLDTISHKNGFKNDINVIPTSAPCNDSNASSQDTVHNTSNETDCISQNGSNGFSTTAHNIKNKECNGSSSSSVHKTGTTNGVTKSASFQNGASQDISVRPKMLNEIVPIPKNGLSQNSSIHKQEKSDEDTQVSVSNGVSPSSKSKSKKKGKGKVHEKNDGCSVAATANGFDKTTAISENDSKKELSDEFSSLTVCDDAPSNQDTFQVEVMDSNISVAENCLEQSPMLLAEASSTVRTSNTLPFTYSAVVKDSHLQDKQGIDANAKKCDAIDLPDSSENHNPIPESGRCSETLSDTELINANGELGATGGESSPEPAYCDSLSVQNPQFRYYEVMTYGGVKAFFPVPSLSSLYLKDIGCIGRWTDAKNSNDSGRGGSEIIYGTEALPNSMVFQFELPSKKCGVLIGRKGTYVNLIKNKTNASILISMIPFEYDKRLITVSGDEHEIQSALELIRRRFPVDRHPEVTLEHVSTPNIICPSSLQLTLPENMTFQVCLSATVNAGHFFVQLPTHSSFHALTPFTHTMTSMYSSCHSPAVDSMSPGNIVAADAFGTGWYRAMIVEVYEDQDTCQVKYLDYGGYNILPRQALRQIHMELMHMPFQAIECYLAGVTCHEEQGWTAESKFAFESMATNQVLSAYVAEISEDGIPCVYLYQCKGAVNTFINQALVDGGYLKWINVEAEKEDQ